MTDNSELDPRKLTFSQARGYEPIPGPLALGEISDEARNKIWDLLLYTVWYKSGSSWNWVWNTPWRQVFRMLHREFLKRPMDAYPSRATRLVQLYRQLILYNLELNELFDLLQFIMRDPNCPRDFTSSLAELFKECRLAYAIDRRRPVTIWPAVTPQEGEKLLSAIREFREAGLSGAEAHLREAARLVNGADWPGAVRESIHAVESVARQLDPAESNTLPEALKSLERRGDRLHPAMKIAIEKLYAFASDEEGVRHSLTDNAVSSVGRDEAVFMLGACASASSYLWRKYRGIS